jgi:hypothetical protein
MEIKRRHRTAAFKRRHQIWSSWVGNIARMLALRRLGRPFGQFRSR